MSSPLSNLPSGGDAAKPALGQTLVGAVDTVGLLASRTIDGVVDTAGLALDLVSHVANDALDTLGVLDPLLESLSSQLPALDLARLRNELAGLGAQLTHGVVDGLGDALDTVSAAASDRSAQLLPNALGPVTTALSPLPASLAGTLRPIAGEMRSNALLAPRPHGSQPAPGTDAAANTLLRGDAAGLDANSQFHDDGAVRIATSTLAATIETDASQAAHAELPLRLEPELLFALGLASQGTASTPSPRSHVGVEAQGNPQQIAQDRIPPFVDQPLPAWQASATSDGGSTSRALAQLQAAVIGFYARAPSPGSVAAELGHAHYGSYVHSLSYAEQRDYNLDVVREQMRRAGVSEPQLEAELARLELFRPALG